MSVIYNSNNGVIKIRISRPIGLPVDPSRIRMYPFLSPHLNFLSVLYHGHALVTALIE